MITKVLETNNVDETFQLGFKLGLIIKEKPAVILLDGPMASGKTSLTKGIASGYGILGIVNSPTYTILKKYQTPDRLHILYHLDLYRLDGLGFDFDLEEYIYADACVIIEWPNQAKALLPTDYLNIMIQIISPDKRLFIISGEGIYQEVVNKL